MILCLLSYMLTNILIIASFTYFVVSTLNTIENYKLGLNTNTNNYTRTNSSIYYYDDTGYLDGLYN